MRYVLGLSYCGTTLSGWQRQPNAPSVQQHLEAALSLVLRQPVAVVGAGRTDAGVHATGQHAHFDAGMPLPPDLLHRLNAVLPQAVAVHRLYQAPEGFHARYSALSRQYRYRLAFRKDPFLLERAWWLAQAPHWPAVHQATQLVLQNTNFASFCKAQGNQKTYECQVLQAEWTVHAHGADFVIAANRFLRGMVRALVGTILEVGYGKRSLEAMQHTFSAQTRTAAGKAAPAWGLYLEDVAYPAGQLHLLDEAGNQSVVI